MSRYKQIASGYALLIKDQQILLMRRCHTGYEDGKYGLPSGHIEEHETLRQGMVREIKEEIGLTIPVDQLQIAHIMHRKSEDERIDFFFVLTDWKGTPQNKEPEKCDDLAWFHLNKLPDTIIPYISEAITNYRKGILYSEYGW